MRHSPRILLGLFVVTLCIGIGAPALAAPAPNCAPNALLVNPCRAWLGARTTDYPEAGSGPRAQVENHEQRIGRPLDIVHTYAPVGELPLQNKENRYLALRSDTYLFQNWKPSQYWRDAGGQNTAVNKHIDAAADAIKSLGSKKIFLTLHHEPENDVTAQAGCKTKAGASAGTTAEYRQMWANVRHRFDARGATNVVWVMDYMNYPTWDCLVPALYPGDQYVDWIMFNAYGASWNPDYVKNVDRFQQILTKMQSPTRNVLGKPWGIVEWGIKNATPAQARSYYQQADAALKANRFPRLKAYMIFDSPGEEGAGGLRVRYDDSGRTDLREQESYRSFANDPALARR